MNSRAFQLDSDVDTEPPRLVAGVEEDRSRSPLVTRGLGAETVSNKSSRSPGLRACGAGTRLAMRDPANIEESAAWFAQSRKTLNLTGEGIAAAIGCGVRTWWAWENGETLAPHVAYLAVRRLLNSSGLDSCGKVRVA